MKKKIIFGIFLLTMLIFLTGCTDKATDTNGKKQDTFNINETAVYENVNYTVENVKYSYEYEGIDADHLYKPKDGYKFVIATIKVKNNSNASVDPNPGFFFIADEKSFEAEDMHMSKTYNTSLDAGDSITYDFFQEVPKDENVTKLELPLSNDVIIFFLVSD